MAFIATAAIVGASVAAAGGLTKLGMSLAGRGGRIREQKAAKARQEKMMREYEKLDTSNIYADVKNPYADIETEFENVYEDMTVNQQQAQFEKQMAQQQQANIMQQMSGAAGGSGIAGLAQAMANQGALTTQRIAASIGQQESMNQRLRALGAAAVQAKERYGDALSTQWETERRSTLFGMDMQRMAAAKQANAAAKQRLISGQV